MYFISYCSIFNDRLSFALSSADLVIISHSFRFVKRFLKSFLNFFSESFSRLIGCSHVIPSEILPNFSPLGLSLWTPQSLRSINFRRPLCDSLHIISQTFSFVKRFYKSFLRFFRSFSRLIGYSYVIRFRLLKPVRLFRDSVYVRCFLRQLAYYTTP